jgi:hypothetical protein
MEAYSMLVTRIIICTLASLLCSSAFAESFSLGVGLAIDPPADTNVTYQVMPRFEARAKVLAGWTGDKLEYVASVQKLPPGWLDADKYFTGLLRDIKAASKDNSVTVLHDGHYETSTGLHGAYIEYAVLLRGSETVRQQVVHHLSDNTNAYVSIATTVADKAADKVLTDTVSIFKTASLTTDAAPVEHREGALVGQWIGTTPAADGQQLITRFELKPDLTFASLVLLDGNTVFAGTGTWSLDDKTLNWDYLNSTPELSGQAKLDADEVVSLQGNRLTVQSKRSGAQRVFFRM